MPGAAPPGYTGQISLGGATFSLAIDAGSFEREMAKAEQSARAASHRIGQSLGRGSSAAQGLFYLGQAVDDLQYGFRAIVNNIPQLVMAFGGGAGVAGAVGIAAVAINQFVNHIDEFKAAAENSEPIQKLIGQIEDLAKALDNVSKAATGQGLQDLLMGLAGSGKIGKAMSALGIDENDRADGARIARERARGDAAIKELSKVGSSEARERGKLFREAVEAFGGGDKLREEYAQRLMNGNPKLSLRDANGMAAQVIMNAMEGGKFGGGQFGNAFEKVFGKIAMDADTKKLNKAGEENEKNTTGLHTNWNKILTQEGRDNERRWMAQLEEERHQIQKRLTAQQEAMANVRTPQMYGSAREYLSSVTVSSADGIRKQQLDVQKGMKRELEKIREQMWKVSQARFQ